MSAVGVVGLGAMGAPIARRLAQAGYPTAGYDRDPTVRVEGLHQVAALADLGPADVVFVVVPADADVTEVVTRLLVYLRRDAVVAVCASVHPDTCRHLAALANARGVHLLDVALTGGVGGAAAGRLNLLVGGDAAVADRLSPVFGAIAHNYHLLGPVGAGQVAKTASNLLHWAEIVAVEEALRLAAAYGVSPRALRGALQEGGTDSRTLREIELMRFTWYDKDLAIARDLAGDIGLELPVATLARHLMDRVSPASVQELLG
jgi:3-hydroxyisobutyrate dehydrogenase-like beta-hydroxyacid dehydrogenase